MGRPPSDDMRSAVRAVRSGRSNATAAIKRWKVSKSGFYKALRLTERNAAERAAVAQAASEARAKQTSEANSFLCGM